MSQLNPQTLIGKDLPGGYRVSRLIGAGALAWVFKATDNDQQAVAIKVLKEPVGDARTMFAREIKVLRQLPPSPHCVRYVADGVTEDDAPFLVMEFIDGCTLKDAFQFQPVWEAEEGCKFMVQLCDALTGLHRLGLAHRDLKPENIMLTQSWQVKLMDLGLVKDAQGLLKLFETEDILRGRDFVENIDKAMLAGTPEYMAPEQFSDPMVEDETEARTDTWTDVYSLGLIFHELLVGQKLFPFRPAATDSAGYSRELLDYIKARLAHTDDQLQRPEAIPEGLWPIVARALRQNPKQRQFSAAQLREEIQTYLDTGASPDEDLDEDMTSMADMSSLLAAARAAPAQSAPAAASAPASTAASAPASTAASAPATAEPAAARGGAVPPPLDIAAIQAYRESKLNAPGAPDVTLPPGRFNAAAVLPTAIKAVEASQEAPAPRTLTVPPSPAMAPPAAASVAPAPRAAGGSRVALAAVSAAVVVVGAVLALVLSR